MVTPAPDGPGSATTVPGVGPFDRPSGVSANVEAPCALLSREVLATLEIDPALVEPLATAAGACRIEAQSGAIEVTISPYPSSGRKAAYVAYDGPREIESVYPGVVPGSYYRGDGSSGPPEIALFPDNAMVVLTLPAQSADLSPSSLESIVDAVEREMRSGNAA
jgi:hypothetical protein